MQFHYTAIGAVMPEFAYKKYVFMDGDSMGEISLIGAYLSGSMKHGSHIACVLLALFLMAIWSLAGQDTVYSRCPMDPDVRSSAPGICPRCGMKLRSGMPEPVEYPVDLRVKPAAPRPGETTRMEFLVRNPWNRLPVTKFQPVHEKLFHLFVVSQDLQFFAHEHPDFRTDGRFGIDLAFPGSGLYRMLADFYPDGGTPQLAVKTSASYLVKGQEYRDIGSRLLHEVGGQSSSGAGYRSAAANRGDEDYVVFPGDACGRAGAVSRSVGALACCERRSDRSDS